MAANRTSFLRPHLIPLALAIPVAGCGGDSGSPAASDGGVQTTLVVADGAFEVTSKILYDTCNSKGDYDGTYDVHIDSLTFSMGDEWTGTWYPGETRAPGGAG